MDFCFGGDFSTAKSKCLYPFAERMLQFFEGYGLNGTITMAGNTTTPLRLVEVTLQTRNPHLSLYTSRNSAHHLNLGLPTPLFPNP